MDMLGKPGGPPDRRPRPRPGSDGTSRYWRGVPKITWLFLGYFLVVLLIGIVALLSLTDDASAASVLALVGTVFGAVSTHLAHTAGHQMARE